MTDRARMRLLVAAVSIGLLQLLLQLHRPQHSLHQHHDDSPSPAAGAAAAAAAAADAYAAAAGPSSAPLVDVWILAGQSNMVGWNKADGQPMPQLCAPWPGEILAFNSTGEWVDAVPNVHTGIYDYPDQDSCGPDMAFARTLIQMGAARKVGLVPTAMGGTNLFQHWAPGGQLWSNMVGRTQAGMHQMAGRGRLRGMLWIQGEADGAGSMQQAFDYGSNFTAWLAATRSALSALHPQLPVLMVIMMIMATRQRDIALPQLLSALSALHPQLPVLMVIMATRQRSIAFPHIDIVAAQQRALQLPGLFKLEMTGFEFYPMDVGLPGGEAELVHLTKAGCAALGVAMGYLVASKDGLQCSS
ncbi:hypothetical protein OEZ85_005831 [Tetradesmus obliquus]|uniref:Sialate O-acetylesterase domain-containing protein n=1 Tax=Tetradesmus obliquus TaxID=3088 RepID=A0ABY8UFB0_TETOB|nr:hypothetical protein OEZ85_005831 [Tetradesmus obliquus]